MSLENKHIVVTGGAGALGRAVVGRLLTDGAICHTPGFFEGELADFPFRDHDRVVVAEGLDLRDAAAVDAYYADIPSLWASVNLAGGYLYASLADTDAEAFEDQWRMNVQTCFHACRSAVRAMRGGSLGEGRIVNVAARAALEPRQGANMVAYTAAKAAVAAMTVALAEELAGERIWVNAVAPSILDTPGNRAAMPDADHAKWPKLEDVAETVWFLASAANRTTRGGVVPVYGHI